MTFPRGVPFLLAIFLAANLIAATEIPIGTTAVVSAPGSKSAVATASDGRDFLVVWNDERTQGEQGNSRMLAARVTREGKVLDPFGISLAAKTAALPHVFFAGGAYVVVWVVGDAFHATRITSDGTIVTPPHVVARGHASSSGFAATNGRTIVIVHRSTVSPYAMTATVLDADTNPIAAHSLVPGTAPSDPPIRSGATIASNGDGYVVLWGSLTPPKMWPDSSLDAVRLDANGSPLDPAERTIGTAADVRIAGNSSGYVLLAREPDRRNSEVRTTRALTTDLSLGDAQVIPANTPYNASLIGFPDRFLFLNYSHGSSTIEVHDVAANGALTNSRTIVRSPAGFLSDFPTAASNGSELLVPWIRSVPAADSGQPSDYRVEAQVFDSAAFTPKSDAVLLTKSANEQQHPAIAYGPDQHLVVWSDREGLFATRVENGVSLDGRGMQLAAGRTGPASVVFDGRSYIVAWWQHASPMVVYARFISPDGEVDEPLHFDSTYAYVTLATNGPSTLMLWGDTTIQAVRLDRTTRTASAPITVPSNPGYAYDLTAAWNGTHFLVAWAETRFDELPMFHPFPRATPRIMGLRLTESLGVVDATPRLLAQSPQNQSSLYSSLASDGRDWLLVWTDDYNLRARRITADGTPQGPLAGVPVGLPAAAIPAIIWDGGRYAVAWRAGDYHVLTLPVHLAYISPTVNVATTIVVVPGSGYAVYEERVSLSRAASGIAVAYTRPAWEAQFGGVDRVFMKTFAQRRRALR